MASQDTRREQIKLRATFINNMASGTYTAGVLTPMIALAIGTNAAAVTIAALIAVICFGLCFVLHLMATEHLNEMDK